MVSTLNLSAGDRLQLNYVRILLRIGDWGRLSKGELDRCDRERRLSKRMYQSAA
ncbi:MAG: hypothetical protein RM338_24590 [Nostoc sp. DedQUE12a]|nr:hypothetical protein [Nostoc sp. DedQUE12a]